MFLRGICTINIGLLPEVKSEPQRQSPTEDDEREDLNSSAEIRDPVKYEEIFQPKHKLGQPPEKPSTPFPAPLEDKVAGPKEAPCLRKNPHPSGISTSETTPTRSCPATST
ncbi:putative katanin p80 WD40 repeat-containing subunit B1-like [Apostichopus japonicus]|uniref:Putative katanin p80 WD40 repeat-containing subunit B1-like n=1 Tax=Stichopus japonicus TaxID=307972 RepID=A0A2G8K267_STIJA|nr:putative katanin p80 WD40 repeat-containing subunit B1-like [Apostichopus japonicus]